VTEAGERRRTRSYSQLSEFHQCSWRFYLRRFLKVKEQPSVWTAGGNAFHKTTEMFDEMLWQENDLSKQDARPWYGTFVDQFENELDELRAINPDESTWRAASKGREDVAFWRKLGPVLISQYIQWRTSTNDTLRIAAVKGAPAVEVKVETSLGGVPVVGYIDRVFQDTETGVLEIVDYKSGARMPQTPDQLGQYSVQLEQQEGVPVTWGAFYNARKATLDGPIDLRRYTEQSFGEEYQQLEASLEAKKFEPNITALCKACGVKDACKFVGGIDPMEAAA
jgi:RecB family exonuclease